MDETNAKDLQKLIKALTALTRLDPIERARRAPGLIDQSKSTLAAIRQEAIHEATRAASWDDVAEQLNVSVPTINKAVTAYRRRATS